MRSRPILTLPGDTPPRDVQATLDRDGVVVVADAVPPTRVASFLADMAEASDAVPVGSLSGDPEWEMFHGARTRRIYGLATRSGHFSDFLLHPRLLAYADAALLGAGSEYSCNHAQAIEVAPGEVDQYLHRDQSDWPWFNPLGPGGPEVIVNAMFALTDFTLANGATRAVVGSHRVADRDNPYDPAAATPAEMEAGSVMLWSGRTVHAAGSNRTESSRWGLNVGLCLGWLRTAEAHHLEVDAATARRLPEPARRLLGFTQYTPPVDGGGRLGLVDGEDPAPFFDPAVASSRSTFPDPLDGLARGLRSRRGRDRRVSAPRR